MVSAAPYPVRAWLSQRASMSSSRTTSLSIKPPTVLFMYRKSFFNQELYCYTVCTAVCLYPGAVYMVPWLFSTTHTLLTCGANRTLWQYVPNPPPSAKFVLYQYSTLISKLYVIFSHFSASWLLHRNTFALADDWSIQLVETLASYFLNSSW